MDLSSHCAQIRTIDRKQEVPHDGAMCDLLWSDPEVCVAGSGSTDAACGRDTSTVAVHRSSDQLAWHIGDTQVMGLKDRA